MFDVIFQVLRGIRIANIVTSDDRRFQAITRELPEGAEPVRLWGSYLTNFPFPMGRWTMKSTPQKRSDWCRGRGTGQYERRAILLTRPEDEACLLARRADGFGQTKAEYDNVARALTAAAKHARKRNIAFGIEPVNRYENHLINTGWQARWMIEVVGADNIFVHLDS